MQSVFYTLPEKVLLDAFYLVSIGRYSPDLSSLDLTGSLPAHEVLP